METPRANDDLCCPRCAGTLAAIAAGLRCVQCATEFPRFGSVACLVDDPPLWRTLWLRRLDDYSSGVQLRVGSLRQEAEAADLLPRTKQRLLRIAAAFEEQLEIVHALFEPLQADADLLPGLAIPTRPEPGATAAILECYENVFRDWAWGERECELTLAFLRPALPEGLGRVAVYGAGAGRLAADVHRTAAPTRTFAVDVNPLPFLIADRLLGGETLSLAELPVDPHTEANVVVPRALTLPFAVPPGLSLIFADALRPPFAPGSLDLVLTSWFIDAARVDLRQTAAEINRVLRPGGLWVNLGPLRFRSVLSRAYTVEETLELVAGSAFELTSSDSADLPYFDSPVSGSRRTETVLRFVARKRGEAPKPEIPDLLPAWVTNPFEPIPITPALIALGRTSMFTTAVLSMIDGTKSTAEVAAALGAAWGIEPARVQGELRAFLAKLPA